MVSKNGFYIEKLQLSGPDVEPAEVIFKDGFNVVFGASNTGKTYISQCIDFTFGRSRVPKPIPQASSYDIVRIWLSDRKNKKQHILKRSLRGGDIELSDGGSDVRTLSATHSKDSNDNVSQFLLDLCDLTGKYVAENKRGKTRTVSFRDISRLTIIDEESIIKSGSPLHSGQRTEEPVRQSIFRLFLTGVDDSSVFEVKEAKVRKAESRGKSEVLDQFEAEINDSLSASDIEEPLDELKERQARLEQTVASIAGTLGEQRANAAEVDQERKDIWRELQRIESRQEVLVQLRARFLLLSKQYTSDLERLKSIAEVGLRLGELKEERCPVCGALAENHNVNHLEQHSSPNQVAAASEAESTKIQILISDLTKTIEETDVEASSLALERSRLESALTTAMESLKRQLQPRVAQVLSEYKEVYDELSKVKDLLRLRERLQKIEYIRQADDEPVPKGQGGVVTKVSTAQAEEFCNQVEGLLASWQLPDAGRVTWSEDSQDIVIAGRDRSVDGKGVRAITHAAFTIALNNFCVDRKMPTSSLVLLDSPLVVYREPDEGEQDFAPNVKAHFYRELAKSSIGRQTIVFENDDPPKDLDRNVNVIHFTRSNVGRYGFIPTDDKGVEPERTGKGSTGDDK